MSDSPPPALSLPEAGNSLLAWCRREPVAALLLAGCLATVAYFFGLFRIFTNGLETAAHWTESTWNAENDLEHGWLILPAAIFIAWYRRDKLAAAPKRSSLAGLAVAVFGVLLFLFSVRTLQPRIAIVALPVLCFGTVYYLWGWATARIVLFPCAFLLFMMPIGFLVSRTVGLQTLTAAVAAKLSSLVGIPVESDGAALRALDNRFQFEVAGGCSGVRSLTAMTMLAALYVHFTQNRLWKKALIFGSSLFFALIGNFIRIFSVIIFARFFDPQVAAGIYHDYSGFIFFPFAVSAMLAFSSLVNRDWAALLASNPATAAAPGPRRSSPSPAPAKTAGGPISYDY